MSEPLALTDLQLDVLRVLWRRGSASVAEISEQLQPERALAVTTVATILSRLEKRGIVRHTSRSRQFVYHPKVSEPDVRRSMVSELTERLFGGDATALVSHLVSAHEVTPGDLDRMKRLLETNGKAGKEERRTHR